MTTTNMGMTLPTVSVTVGPTYATQINAAIDVIDAHNHTSGKGVRIPTAGISIDANLSLNGYTLTSTKAVTHSQQASAIATANSSWFKTDGNFWITNGSGTAVQITSGGTLNTSALITSVYSQLALSGNLTIASTDTYTQYLVNTNAARSITLPPAGNVSPGRFYIFNDVTGLASTNNITIARDGADTIEGTSSYVVDMPYGMVQLVSDGVSKWHVAASSTANSVHGNTFAFSKGMSPATITQKAKTAAGAGAGFYVTAQAAGNGAGGTMNISSGASTGGNGAGGAFNLASGAGNGSGNGGAITIESGAGGSSGRGGNISIKLGGDSAGSSRDVVRLTHGSSGGDYIIFGEGSMSFLSEASTDKPTIFLTDCGALPNSSLPNSAGFLLNSVSGAPWFTLGSGTQFGFTGTTNAAVGGSNTWKLHIKIGSTTYYIPLYTA